MIEEFIRRIPGKIPDITKTDRHNPTPDSARLQAHGWLILTLFND
jgi:hypothetical protein